MPTSGSSCGSDRTGAKRVMQPKPYSSTVAGQWAVVSCSWRFTRDRRGGGATNGGYGRRIPADRSEICVEAWGKLVDQRFQHGHIGRAEQPASISTAEEMLRFIERSTGDPHVSAVIRVGATSIALRNIGSDTISGPNQLLSDSVPIERLPRGHQLPNPVSNVLRQTINTKPLEIRTLPHLHLQSLGSDNFRVRPDLPPLRRR